MKKHTDHLGNEFKYKTEMFKYWGLPVSVCKNREQAGWPLEKILTTPIKVVYDHLGNEFKSDKDMYEYWGIPQCIGSDRKRHKWTLEKILTTPFKDHSVIDHIGNEFKSDKDMYEYWGIPYDTARARKQHNWSLEKILTTPFIDKVTVTDPITGELLYIEEFAHKYNIITEHVYRNNRKNIPLLRCIGISFVIRSNHITINQTKYNLTVSKRIKKGKDVFECYIDNGDRVPTFKIMTYDMIDQYCLEQYKKLHNIT